MLYTVRPGIPTVHIPLFFYRNYTGILQQEKQIDMIRAAYEYISIIYERQIYRK